jgi:hypothetical protein
MKLLHGLIYLLDSRAVFIKSFGWCFFAYFMFCLYLFGKTGGGSFIFIIMCAIGNIFLACLVIISLLNTMSTSRLLVIAPWVLVGIFFDAFIIIAKLHS